MTALQDTSMVSHRGDAKSHDTHTVQMERGDSPAVLEALRVLRTVHTAPDVHWIPGDDLCDCLFQQIAETSNPYLGRTHRIRLCCVWADILRQYPQYVQELPYYDSNTHTYESQPVEWDSSEMDMPLYLWHRQIAIREGKSVAEVREEYAGREHERPKKVAARPKHKVDLAKLRHAWTERLRASGWLLPGQKYEGPLDAK